MNNQDFRIDFQNGTRIEQIEQSCLYLLSIFEALNTDLTSDEHRLSTGTIANFSQIGAAFVDAVYANISNFVESETGNLEIEKVDLAVALSQILNDSNLPITLYNRLQNAIAEAYTGGDNERLNQFESSPEFMRAVIEASQKDEN